MIEAVGKYADVRRPGARARRGVAGEGAGRGTRGRVRSPGIFVPTAASRRMLLQDWWWRETKEGGGLHEYVRREKGQMPTMIRRVARLMASFEQNTRSDVRLVAAVPARLYQRLKDLDQDFFSDNQNLKSLRRDNPEAVVKL